MAIKKIMILGCDGYIGHPLTMRCLNNRHKVVGVDNYSRRKNVNFMKSSSVTGISSVKDRRNTYSMLGDFTGYDFDITNLDTITKLISRVRPSVIVNLAHNPSASFSMINGDIANEVLNNNIIGTNNVLWAIKQFVPECHYITIGSTGEYNHRLNVDIEEGYFTFDKDDRTSEKCIFPREGNSIYHCSKIASTYLIDYLTRIWKLKCTDVMQSIVFGLWTPETVKYREPNRCDIDECFGTVLNRFVVQAIAKHPLTVFGEGNHKRAFLSLNDSIQALEIAINNEPERGIVQTWNQLSEWHSMNDIADKVISKIDGTIQNIPSPRGENTTDHYYFYKTDKLKELGYKPSRTIEQEIDYMNSVIKCEKITDAMREVLVPKIKF